jgi:hypothetical protein
VVKKLLLIVSFTLWLSSGLSAQEVVLSDEFDSGDGMWNTGWVEGSTQVTFSIDNTGILSGANSYLIDVVEGGAQTYFIQRNANCPLLEGQLYTVSFLAVADRDVTFNVLFEINADPWTKRLNEWPEVTTTPQEFTYTMSATENVPTNQLKLHFGGPDNDTVKVWIDNIVVTRQTDPALVSQWGETNRGKGMQILNDSTTAAGDGAMGSPTGTDPTVWSTIRGGFDTIEVSLGETIVATGQFEYVGSGPGGSYVGLRYALTYQPSAGTLQYQYTDSANWPGTGNHWGYQFTPRSGTSDIANGTNGAGTVWYVNGAAGWNSTYNAAIWPIETIVQAPRFAEIAVGVYDFAISVTSLTDTTNEIRWSMFHTDRASYWYAGTVIDTAVTKKFNGICFGIGNALPPALTEFRLTGVRVEKGDPIVVPEAPFESFYVDAWGALARFGWPILNDSSTFVGDGLMGSTSHPSGNWATIMGYFGENVRATQSEAIKISGELEFTGSPTSWSALRYGLFNFTDPGDLYYQYTDSARWGRIINPGTDSAAFVNGAQNAYGYLFTPTSGTNGAISGTNGLGTQWSVNGASWITTNAGSTIPMGAVDPAPNRAQMVAGVYDFEISVQPLGDGTNEVRFYLFKDDEAYWYGGTVIDTMGAATEFNGVIFGVNNGNGIENTDVTALSVYAVEVDRGVPIVVPPKPWIDYYIAGNQWGFIGNRTGGWTNEPGALIGDFTLSGANPPTDWAAVQAGFIEPVELVAGEILVVEGDIILEGGGFQDWSSLRLGMFYSDSAGTVAIDSVLDSSYVWTGVESHHSGYLFLPHSGTNTIPTWSGTAGTYGAIANGTWLSTNTGTGYVLGDYVQVPAGAVAGAGTYEFKMGVQLLANGTADVRMQLMNGDDYVWEASAIDANSPLATTKFNCVCFAINNTTTTAMRLEAVKVTKPAEHIVLDVQAEVSDLIPTQYTLEQNYPNPFNPTTTIKFGLPRNSEVKLVIYDVLGQVAAEFAKKAMNAGYHEITFDASHLSSGIYFYKLEAGDFVNVKKMMLLK